jgi:hypothetical protein
MGPLQIPQPGTGTGRRLLGNQLHRPAYSHDRYQKNPLPQIYSLLTLYSFHFNTEALVQG